MLHRTNDGFMDVRHSREYARRIPGARLVELPGSDSLPSSNCTRTRLAPATTCRLVRITPRLMITTPLPTARWKYSSCSRPSPIARTRTIEGRTAWYALIAGDGTIFVSSVRVTAWSMSSCVMTCGGVMNEPCNAISPTAAKAPASTSSGFS